MIDPLSAILNYLISGPILKVLFSPTTVTGPHGVIFQGPQILLIALVFLTIASFIWIWNDSQKRGKSGFITLLFILLAGWPFSYLWWVWLRPPLTRKTDGSTAPAPALRGQFHPQNT